MAKSWSDMTSTALKNLQEKLNAEEKKKLQDDYLKIYTDFLKEDFKFIPLTMDNGYQRYEDLNEPIKTFLLIRWDQIQSNLDYKFKYSLNSE